MTDYYSGYSSQPQQPPQGGGGNSFYEQGGYGRAQESGGGTVSSSFSYEDHGAPKQSWKQEPSASAQQSMGGGPMGSTPSQPTQPQQQSLFNPAMAAAAISNVAAGGFTADSIYDGGSKMVEGFLDQSTARLIPGLDLFMRTLRVYFAVDNRFVKRKIQRVLFPFISKDWERLEDNDVMNSADNSISYCPPVQDENAFDLYIPLMGLITYVLLCALCYGSAGAFNPEVLPDVSTKCFATQIIEVLAIRGGFYAMHAPVKFLDLFSVTGYKYVGLSINMLAGLILGQLGWGHRGYYGTFLWTASAASYFMFKTMAKNVPRATAATGPKREIMVLSFAGSQFATMWFVSQTKFLN